MKTAHFLSLTGLIFCGVVQAHTFSRDECSGLGHDSIRFVIHRDAGMSLDMATKAVEEIMAAKLQDPSDDMYVKDGIDVELVLKALSWVWAPEQKGLTPGQAFDHFYGECTKGVPVQKEGMPAGIEPKGEQLKS